MEETVNIKFKHNDEIKPYNNVKKTTPLKDVLYTYLRDKGLKADLSQDYVNFQYNGRIINTTKYLAECDTLYSMIKGKKNIVINFLEVDSLRGGNRQ